MHNAPAQQEPIPLAEAMSESELQALRERIVASGALGRSPIYTNLLDYLLLATHEGRQPKEIEIAIDVMGRDASFDVSRDSVVRVYIHQLRKRLQKFYDRHEPDADYQLLIPKGQYTLVARLCAETMPNADDAAEAKESAPLTKSGKTSTTRNWSSLISVLLACNLLMLLYLALPPALDRVAGNDLHQHDLWQNILGDERPVLVVMGDYYIFGELDEQGRVFRMVRDFQINSADDLSSLLVQDRIAGSRYMNLNSTYLPEGSADALARIMPVLEAAGKNHEVTMMSRLDAEALRTRHIIYIGYISALGKLDELYFSASGLRVGRSYDELLNRHNPERYISDAGIPEQGQAFRDISLTATFPGSAGNQFLLITGTRDAGLIYSARAVTQSPQLRTMERALQKQDATARANSFESVSVVFGADRKHVDSSLLYSAALDPSRVWQYQAR